MELLSCVAAHYWVSGEVVVNYVIITLCLFFFFSLEVVVVVPPQLQHSVALSNGESVFSGWRTLLAVVQRRISLSPCDDGVH